MLKVSAYILQDLIKNKIIIGYLVLLSAVGWGIFSLEGQPEKALLALMQMTLFVVPLLTLVFTSTYYHNSREFALLILAQPIDRAAYIRGFYGGLFTAFASSFILGIGLPLLIFYPGVESLLLLLCGLLLTAIFTAVALYIGTHIEEKARSMGITLLIWIFFAFLFDGLLLMIMYQFAAYPIERVILFLVFFNPIDLARTLIIMKTEAAAMLGLSGAVFQQFFGTLLGGALSIAAMLIWTLIPLWFTFRKFQRKDL